MAEDIFDDPEHFGVRGDGLVEIKTGEGVRRIMAAAQETHGVFEDRIREAMTPEIAQRIRQWRVADGHTWRGVAYMCGKELGWDWIQPVGNQLAGMAACEIVASMDGQDYMAGEWNG